MKYMMCKYINFSFYTNIGSHFRENCCRFLMHLPGMGVRAFHPFAERRGSRKKAMTVKMPIKKICAIF
jgi:hypothetical protein